MVTYVVRRLLLLPVVLIAVSLLIFLMLQCLSPYQRATAYITNPTKLRGGDIYEIIQKYGLDDPLPIQYIRWLNSVVRGNLGWSETAKTPVLDAILRRLPATLELALYASIPLVAIGIWLGTISATHHNGLIDHTTRVIAITGWSVPTFVLGIVVLMVFYGALDWFPPGRLSTWADQIVNSPDFQRHTGLNTLDALLNGRITVFADALRHLVLPVITLAYVSWALILRIMRASMLDTLRQDYILTARAKGLTEKVVIKKHARRNALMPVVTVAGLVTLSLVNGVVIVETIFHYEGIGRWAAQAALQLDAPSVLGFALFCGVAMVIGNLIVDVLYAYIDPRVKLE